MVMTWVQVVSVTVWADASQQEWASIHGDANAGTAETHYARAHGRYVPEHDTHCTEMQAMEALAIMLASLAE